MHLLPPPISRIFFKSFQTEALNDPLTLPASSPWKPPSISCLQLNYLGASCKWKLQYLSFSLSLLFLSVCCISSLGGCMWGERGQHTPCSLWEPRGQAPLVTAGVAGQPAEQLGTLSPFSWAEHMWGQNETVLCIISVWLTQAWYS